MKRYQFFEKCLELLIDPQLALENEDVVKALKEGDDAKVFKLLETEF